MAAFALPGMSDAHVPILASIWEEIAVPATRIDERQALSFRRGGSPSPSERRTTSFPLPAAALIAAAFFVHVPLAALWMPAAPPTVFAEEHAETPPDPPNRQTGTNGADDLRGGDGADLLIGKRGNDKLRGKDGNDELRGGRGKDTLRGGAGDDVLYGGRGKDRFAFSVGASGHKTVTDFEAGDVIQLGADPQQESWPAAADIVAGVEAQGGRHTYTLLPGLTLETRTPLRVEHFVFLSGAPVDSPHAVALPVEHDLNLWLARNPGGRLTVPAGEYRDAGGVRFSCPAGGADCEVTVTAGDDETWTVSSNGGVATAAVKPPAYVYRPGDPPPPPSRQTAPSTLAGATAHGVASAIVSLEDDALTDPFLSWPVADRPLTLGVPYHVLPLSLHKLSKGILGGELDNDQNPSTPTPFVDAAAPPAISGWTGSARQWSRTDRAGVTITDTVTLYSKAGSEQSPLSFGWWARIPDAVAVAVGTFGNDPTRSGLQTRNNPRSLNVAWPRGANAFVAGRHYYWPGDVWLVTALSGTATYAGAAAGQWSERAVDARDGSSGAFTADATLTANFDVESDVRLSGNIANFRNAAGVSLGNWTAALANDTGVGYVSNINGGAVGGTGNTAGAADGRNWTGGWVAQFFRRSAADSHTAHPTAVGGVFQAHLGTPAMAASNDQGFVGVVGAFGAEKQ